MSDANFEANMSNAPDQSAALSTKLRLACHTIRIVTTLWAVWNFCVYAWVWSDRDALLARQTKLYGLDPMTVTDIRYWSASALEFVSWLVSLIVVFRVWRLTRAYLDGRVFTMEAASRLRAVALAGLMATAVDAVLSPLSGALVLNDLLGRVPIYYWFNPTYLLYALMSGFLLALSVVFESAAEVANENAQFV